jgi:hypothetical protein
MTDCLDVVPVGIEHEGGLVNAEMVDHDLARGFATGLLARRD